MIIFHKKVGIFLYKKFSKNQISLILKSIDEVKGKKLYVKSKVASLSFPDIKEVTEIKGDFIFLNNGGIFNKSNIFRVDLFRNRADKYLKELKK